MTFNRRIDDDAEDERCTEVFSRIIDRGNEWDMFDQQVVHVLPGKGFDPEVLMRLVASGLRSFCPVEVVAK